MNNRLQVRVHHILRPAFPGGLPQFIRGSISSYPGFAENFQDEIETDFISEIESVSDGYDLVINIDTALPVWFNVDGGHLQGSFKQFPGGVWP